MKGDWLRPLDLHDDGAFQHVHECMRVVAMDGVRSARRILYVSIVPSLPGMSVRSRDINVVTFAGVIKRSLQFKTEPAKFLVVFVKNKGAPILTPVE